MGTDVAFIKDKIEEQEKKNRRDKKIVQRVEDVAEQYAASLFGGIRRMIAEFEEGIIVSEPREPVVDLSESELSETFSRMKEKIKNHAHFETVCLYKFIFIFICSIAPSGPTGTSPSSPTFR